MKSASEWFDSSTANSNERRALFSKSELLEIQVDALKEADRIIRFDYENPKSADGIADLITRLEAVDNGT